MRGGLRTLATVIALGVAANACQSHVALQAPAPNAPLEERARAYDRLRPVRSREKHVVGVGMGGLLQSESRTIEYLELAGGDRVHFAEDLLPLVPPQSATANKIHEAARRERTASWLGLSALAALGAGVALVVLSQPGSDNRNIGLLGAGVVIGLGGSLSLGVASQAVMNSATDERAAAYDLYDADLRRRLSIRLDGP